jgi:hypothetical protein
VFWVEEDASYTSLGSGNDGLFVVGQWCLYTIVRRGTAGAWYCDIYGNGDFFETKGPTSENPPTGDDYRLFFGGYRGGSLNLPSQGYLDDFRLYNRALGPNEIKAIYINTRDGTYGDLAAKPQRFYNIPFTAAEPEVVAATHKQIDLVEGPSSEFDVVTEARDERRGATGRGTFCPVGVVNASSFGTRSDPSTQAGLNRLDNRFVRGANQGDKIKAN